MAELAGKSGCGSPLLRRDAFERAPQVLDRLGGLGTVLGGVQGYLHGLGARTENLNPASRNGHSLGPRGDHLPVTLDGGRCTPDDRVQADRRPVAPAVPHTVARRPVIEPCESPLLEPEARKSRLGFTYACRRDEHVGVALGTHLLPAVEPPRGDRPLEVKRRDASLTEAAEYGYGSRVHREVARRGQ